MRDDASDVLEGWDRGATPEEIAGWDHDEPPVPVDTIAVLGGGVVGAILGLLWRGNRVRGALLGGLTGLIGVGSLRRVWHSPDGQP